MESEELLNDEGACLRTFTESSTSVPILQEKCQPPLSPQVDHEAKLSTTELISHAMKFVPKIDLSLQTAEAEISIDAPPDGIALQLWVLTTTILTFKGDLLCKTHF